MILLIVAILLGAAGVVWLWKGPIKSLVEAMKKNGSSALEAYVTIFIVTAGLGFAVYMILQVA